MTILVILNYRKPTKNVQKSVISVQVILCYTKNPQMYNSQSFQIKKRNVTKGWSVYIQGWARIVTNRRVPINITENIVIRKDGADNDSLDKNLSSLIENINEEQKLFKLELKNVLVKRKFF